MKILIGMPSLTGDMPIVLTQVLLSLEVKPEWKITFAFTERVLVDRARNALAEKCLNEGHDYLLFLDDDQIPPRDILVRLMGADKDIVLTPVADRNNEGRIALFDEVLEPIMQLKEAGPVGAGGMSATLIKRSVLEAVAKNYGAPFRFDKQRIGNTDKTVGEDVNFCVRARGLGFQVWAIPMKIKHIGRRLAFAYDPETGETSADLI